jgi:hypothetical protein
MLKQKIVITMLVASLLVGCSVQQQVNQLQTSIPTQKNGISAAYPVEGLPPAKSDSYPAPDATVKAERSHPSPPKDVVAPEKGKASISGGIYSFTTSLQVIQTQFYLTPLKDGDIKNLPPAFTGPNTTSGDVSFTTDEKGNFNIGNVPPGKYLVVVWAPYNWILAQKTEKDTDPLVLDLQADHKYPLGIINIAWP